jgi:hypothetical protein
MAHGVQENDGVLVVAETVKVEKFTTLTREYKLSVATKTTAPSGLSAGDEDTPSWVLKFHRRVPDTVLIAYTLPLDPTKSVAPSGLSAGDERTLPSVANFHRRAPDAVLIAYTLRSLELTNTVEPSGLRATVGLSAGDESTLPSVVNVHRIRVSP